MLDKERDIKKTYGQDFGVSEVLGTILIMGIVIAGLALIILLGSSIIGQSKSYATHNGVEQAFTVADSRLSKARFSTSISQEAPFELRSGIISVNGTEDDSYIQIFDYDNNTKTTSPLTQKIALGTIKTVTDQGEIAYQDGGVWSSDGNGNSVMISPPDFDYNGITLTLPIMSIDGNTSMAATGNHEVTIHVNSTEPLVIFPNSSATGTINNPIPSNHSINITIKSDYYQAWANYINSRTRAEAITNPAKKMVNVSLRSGAPPQSGLAGAGYNTRGMDTSYDAPIEVFNLHLVPDNRGNDYTVTYSSESTGGPVFTITVERTTGHDPIDGANKLYAKITYQYVNGTQIEKFQVYVPHERKKEEPLDINMLSHSITAEYLSGSSAQSVTWGDDPASPDSSSKPDYDDSTYRDVTYGGSKTLYDLSQHYLLVMRQWDLDHGEQYGGPTYTAGDGTGNRNNNFKFDTTNSMVTIGFKSNEDIKYLYITKGVLGTNLTYRN